MFIENVGQQDEPVRFQVAGVEGPVLFAPDAIWITLFEREGSLLSLRGASGESGRSARGIHLRLSFVGANPDTTVRGVGRLEGRVSSFLGDDRRRWRSDIPTWAGVRYVDLYPGIDLEVTGRDGRWEWSLVPRAGATQPDQTIRFRVDGADRVAVDGASVRIVTSVGVFLLPPLVIGEPESGQTGTAQGLRVEGNEIVTPWPAPQPVPGAPARLAAQPATRGPFRASATADVRPILFSTLIGGMGGERPRRIVVDPNSGATYLTGRTESGFPDAIGSFSGGSNDAFVAKLDRDGNVAFVTYLGGTGDDQGADLALSADGELFLTGRTDSPDFTPADRGYDRSANGLYDAFVARLDSRGVPTYTTYLGGDSWDYGYAIALAPGAPGVVYVTGMTASEDFPFSAMAFDQVFAGGQEAFLAELDTNLSGPSSRRYASFVGGSAADQGHDISVDPQSGSLYLLGQTESADLFRSFPVPVWARGYTRTHAGGWDAFLLKMRHQDFRVEYATFLGGSGMDCEVPGDSRECRLAVLSERAVFVTGVTASAGFPTTPFAYSRRHQGGSSYGFDGFVARIDTTVGGRASLVYSTLLGGRGDDLPFGIAVDANGSAYVVGRTESCDFPVSPQGFRSTFQGGHEGFIAKLSPNGRLLLQSTFLGGAEVDGLLDVALDPAGVAHVTGWTTSPDFPSTTRPSELRGDSDAFVTVLTLPSRPSVAGPGFGLTEEGASHLSWPFEESAFESPCVVQDDGPRKGAFLCWGQVSPRSECHRSDDLFAEDWVLCDFDQPNCTRSQAGDKAAGTPFLSPVDGKVLFAGNYEFGNQVTMQVYEEGQPTCFGMRVGHLQDGSIAVREGDLVSRGDRLGTVGHTGESSGGFDHAHVALYKNLDRVPGGGPGSGTCAGTCEEAPTGSALWRLCRGGVFESPLCGGKDSSDFAAEFAFDAVRSEYPIEFRFDSPCDFDGGFVRNSGAFPTVLPRGIIRGPAEDFREYARLVPRASGMALELDDVEYVEVVNSEWLRFPSGVGVEALVWRENNSQEDPIIGKWGEDEQWLLTILPEGNGRLLFTVHLSGDRYASVEYDIPDPGYLRSWVHVAATYTRQEGLTLYWQSRPVARLEPSQIPAGRFIGPGRSPIRIGDAGPNRSRFLGRLDSVRVWNAAWPGPGD